MLQSTFLSETKFTLEFPDGRVFSGNAHRGEVEFNPGVVPIYRSIRSSYDREWTINLSGTSLFYSNSIHELAPILVAQYLPKEWKCKYCGRANNLQEIQCQSCGWYRDLITEVLHVSNSRF